MITVAKTEPNPCSIFFESLAAGTEAGARHGGQENKLGMAKAGPGMNLLSPCLNQGGGHSAGHLETKPSVAPHSPPMGATVEQVL